MKSSRAGSDAASTREYPHHHLFRQFGLVTDQRIVVLPEVSSEGRRYLPAAYLPGGVIISNKVYGAPDDGGLLFALASSSMFITWMKLVGGRLESRVSLSSTITWNNFPVPSVLDAKTQSAIVAGGQKVLAARERHPKRSLSAAYNPKAMDPVLVKAHDALDRAVDVAFGASKKLATERQRQEILFARYGEMLAAEEAEKQRVAEEKAARKRKAAAKKK